MNIDWEGHANKLLDTAINVLANKIMGVKTGYIPSGTAVSTPIGSISNFMAIALGGVAVVGILLLMKK